VFETEIKSRLDDYRKSNILSNSNNSSNKFNIVEFSNLFTNEKWKEALSLINEIKYYKNTNEYYTIISNSAVCFHRLNDIIVSKELFKKCLEIKSDFNINKNIAYLELQRKDINKFIKYARRAISIEFNLLLANLLAEKYESIGAYNESIMMYENIIYFDDKNINSYNNLGNLNLLRINQIPNKINSLINEAYSKSLELCHQNNEYRKKELVLSNIIFNNLYNWNLTGKEIGELSSSIWYTYFPKESKLIDLVNSKTNKTNKFNKINKINIGYISCDFLTHPVGFMFHSILKHHDLDKFNIYCYDCADTGKTINDPLTEQLKSYESKWRSIVDKTDEEALTIILDDNIDILVDMMGHTRNTRMNILQYKPAKIQVSYFAYPSTNGINEIDYRFTDNYATPDYCDANFVEKLYRLSGGFQCYTPPDAIRELNSNKDRRKEDTINLCCYNNPIKLSVPTLDMFCDILKKIPNAKLHLKYCYYKSSYYRECMYKLFKDRGIERLRLDITFQPLIEALNSYNNMDIALDPFPYNGGTISSEAIYMNTPLITLAGDTYYSRVGVSLLSNLKLDKYIANSKEEYVDKVVNLANNRNELHLLHQTLRIRMLNSDLADSYSFSKKIENAYIDMMNKL